MMLMGSWQSVNTVERTFICTAMQVYFVKTFWNYTAVLLASIHVCTLYAPFEMWCMTLDGALAKGDTIFTCTSICLCMYLCMWKWVYKKF